MSGHTPGPWTLLPEEVDKGYIRVRGTVLGGRFKVANVLTPTHEGVPEREAKETRANARLITAAPRLLEELKRARRVLVAEGYIPAATMDEAIAEATGEQP